MSAHFIFYNQEGELWGWGSNHSGNVGTGDTDPCRVPRRVKLNEELSQFASGWDHNLALTTDGKLFVWGLNDRGQLGLGDKNNRCTPVPLSMPNGLPITFVACGRDCSYAVTSDGSLFGWGIADYGQLGFATEPYTVVREPQLLPIPSKVTEVWAGRDHVIARTREDEVLVWGHNKYSQCGLDPCHQVLPQKNEILKFSEYFPGGGHTLALDDEKMVWGWGKTNWHQLGYKDQMPSTHPQKIFQAPAEIVAAGLHHNLVLTKNGEVLGWGRGGSGHFGEKIAGTTAPKKIEISTESPVVFLFCGSNSSAVGTGDGSLYWFGKIKIPKDLKIQMPVNVIQKKWDKIVGWLFLGCLDKNSNFFHMPKEILYNFVQVITANRL
jgi:alpha-tubulin suppressor-like RCC1 family protein